LPFNSDRPPVGQAIRFTLFVRYAGRQKTTTITRPRRVTLAAESRTFLTGGAAGFEMPLWRRHAAFISRPAGFYFTLTNTAGAEVLCLVEPEALRAAAQECGLEGAEMEAVFEALRPAIEACASDQYDETALDPDGAVHVRKSALLAA
jgi:hypothetical protein